MRSLVGCHASTPRVPGAVEVSLDGTATTIAPGIAASFRRLTETSFEIVVTGHTPGVAGTGVNRFCSADGRTLVETKTQTFGTAAAAARTLTHELVFDRQDPTR